MSWYSYVASLMLTTLVSLASGLGGLFGTAAGAAAPAPETIRRTLPWSPGVANAVFELSNTRGDIHIVAEDRADISVVATRTVERQGNGNEPGPAVDFRREGDRTLVCGDASHCGCSVEWPRGARWRDDERTKVRVDFEVRLPKQATLDVCAVNGDLMKVEGIEGSYNLHHVNGNLEMVRVRGAGRASTVNGDLVAAFDVAPQTPAEFKTVNGKVDVTLPASLSADLRLKTMNGGLYTDFETTALPVKPIAEQRRGRFRYRADRYVSVRVGKGGPELTFETLNGNVQVRKR